MGAEIVNPGIPAYCSISMDTRSNESSLPAPVGLSDPQYLARRKSMFEFLTHVRALGCVPLPKFFATSRIPVL